jgi:ParB-like chromosome segregation protein Spo0J
MSDIKVNCAFDELVPLERVVPNPRNPNKHSPAQLDLLAKVIAYQGWRAPVVVSTRSGFIVCGHGRYAAAKMLGASSVPVDFQEFATEADEWAHLIADNRLSELSEWDDDSLSEELDALKREDMKLLELTGFTQSDLDAMLVPDFGSASIEDQGKLDEKSKCKCPECGHEFVP